VVVALRHQRQRQRRLQRRLQLLLRQLQLHQLQPRILLRHPEVFPYREFAQLHIPDREENGEVVISEAGTREFLT